MSHSEETAVTLRSVADDIRTWTDTLEGLDEGSLEREQAMLAMAESIRKGADKVDSFAAFLRRLRAEAEYLGSEIDRLNARVHRIEELEERLRNYAISALRSANLRKIQGNNSTLSLRKNPDKVVIGCYWEVPSEFKTIDETVTVDKRALLKALKGGSEIPGCDLEFGGDSLTIL